MCIGACKNKQTYMEITTVRILKIVAMPQHPSYLNYKMNLYQVQKIEFLMRYVIAEEYKTIALL